ncbi:MAG: rod shape-determining protein RodA, partial [Candidatus Omnitrophica bacterium]|nr:rod shape-determining protein RodA [Candidatus Omnitrophota bacterium]
MYRINYRKNFDLFLIILPLIIVSAGLLFLYSASHGIYESNGTNFAHRQAMWLLAGIVMLVIIVNMDFRRILDWSYLCYGIMALMLLVLLFAGGARMGAKRWFSIGWLTFQPSEFAKIILIMVLAFYIGNNRHAIRTIKGLITPFLLAGVLFLLIIKEPDLGSALILLAILFIMLLVSEMPVKYMAGLVIAGVASSPFLWNFLKEYQKRRLLVFINPNMDPLGAGYTIIQSKIAIGSGGLFGRGFLGGTQNQLNFLPESHTDFIFAVIGEEWGFAGVLLVVFLFVFLISRILSVAERTNDFYGKLVVMGVAGMLAFQVIVNIAMTVGLMPVVGIPLPFVSYGGSSLIMNFIAIALVINIDMHRT